MHLEKMDCQVGRPASHSVAVFWGRFEIPTRTDGSCRQAAAVHTEMARKMNRERGKVLCMVTCKPSFVPPVFASAEAKNLLLGRILFGVLRVLRGRRLLGRFLGLY